MVMFCVRIAFVKGGTGEMISQSGGLRVPFQWFDWFSQPEFQRSDWIKMPRKHHRTLTTPW